jgi:riboflavin synthase
VQDLGTIEGVDRTDDGVRLRVSSAVARELRTGDSVAVNGVCLTATVVRDQWFAADVMNATLERTSLHGAQSGIEVNLELPVRADDRLGGHVVQGHVDGVGEVVGVVADGFARRITIAASSEVMRYVVEKGSIAVDGVSLTVADCDDGSFTVSLIPETLHRTTLGKAEAGTRVNLEIDVLAKYVEKLIAK